MSETVSAFGRIDIVVNLAGGLTVYKPSTDVTVDEWTREVNNNVLSAFLVTREAFPHMAKTGGGSVINFARAGNAQANMLPYNVAKAGVAALTRTFALEGKEAKIRVNAVAPGLVDTASNVNMMKPKDTSKWAKRDEIADVVVFLASPAVAGRDGSGPRRHRLGASRQNAEHGIGWPADADAERRDDDRPLDEDRMLQHCINELLIAPYLIAEAELTVDRLFAA